MEPPDAPLDRPGSLGLRGLGLLGIFGHGLGFRV